MGGGHFFTLVRSIEVNTLSKQSLTLTDLHEAVQGYENTNTADPEISCKSLSQDATFTDTIF